MAFMNNNQELIDGLRQAADFLEGKPEFPTLYRQTLQLWTDSKDKLKQAARHLGSCTKEFTATYFELHKPCGSKVEITVCIPRESICKKIVTWDCPDDESLLKLVETEKA